MSDNNKNIATSTASTSDIDAIAGLREYCNRSFVDFLENEVRKNKTFENINLDPNDATWADIFNSMDSKSMFWFHLGDHGYQIEKELETYFGYTVYGEILILKSRDINDWICIIFQRAASEAYILYRTYHNTNQFTGWLGNWKRLSYTVLNPS